MAAERVLLGAEGQTGAGVSTLATSGTLQTLRASARQSGTVRVIVGLRVPFAPAADLKSAEAARQGREIAAAASGLKTRFAGAIARAPGSFRAYGSIPFAAIEVTPEELDRLATDPAVLSITPNMLLQANLDQSTGFIRAPEAWKQGFSGLGQSVAVIDMGVDKTHPFLLGHVVSEACYTSSGWCPGGLNSSTASGSGMPCPNAACAHGTHVAGIISGNPYAMRPLSGVAFNAGIIAIQVFSNTQQGPAAWLSDILEGLQRVYDLRNTYKIAAVNMSLGFSTRYASSCDRASPATTAIIEQLRAAGIATVVASGNAGDSSRISFPACISTAVSVGSVSDRNWGTCSSTGITPAPTAADMVACYSNASRGLTLLAPGSPITSSVPGGGYATMHGTSMATPHVAGAFALIRQKAKDASVDEIVEALRDTGIPVTDYRNKAITTPRIDVKAAIDTIQTDDGKLPVRLTFTGNGSGTVAFTPAGSKSSCTTSCSNRYVSGTVVKLTAAPDAGMSFAGWSGACSGTGPCTITVSAATAVNALFYVISNGPPQELSYTRGGNGTGTVSLFADGQNTSCNADCLRSYGKDTMVTLTAAPNYGNVLSSWSGVCKGRKPSCVVRMSSSKSVGAVFTALPVYTVTYTKAGAGDGAIDISVPESVTTCSSSCANGFPAGTSIRLTARPAAGQSFAGWSGACRGAKTSCTLRLRSATNVTATFN